MIIDILIMIYLLQFFVTTVVVCYVKNHTNISVTLGGPRNLTEKEIYFVGLIPILGTIPLVCITMDILLDNTIQETKEKEMPYEPKVTFLQKKELKIHQVETSVETSVGVSSFNLQFAVDGLNLINLTKRHNGNSLPPTAKLFKVLNENGDVTYEVVE